MSLKDYQRKRNFRRTAEPKGRRGAREAGKLYVIQKHAARRLHYDFRLEIDGALKSWAVPKGPSLDPADKRLAVHVEDHPLEYGEFEGVIPKGEYGGGAVMLWDRGQWESVGNARKNYQAGKLKFALRGQKLRGGWTLVQMRGKAADGKKNWLLIKENDNEARARGDNDVLSEQHASVVSGRTMDRIASDHDKIWKDGRAIADKTKKAKAKKSAKRKESPSSTAGSTPVRAADLTRARRMAQPEKIKPQLATLVGEVPKSTKWLHEIKFDGYRILCVLNEGKVRLWSRNGNDLTRKLRRIAEAAADLPVEQAILDGELVALKSDGSADFQTLQNAFKEGGRADMIYYLFDLPHCDGYDLTRTPLLERKQLLSQILESRPGDDWPVRYSDHIKGQGASMYEHACSFALEGVISKRADSPYRSGRTRSWVKTKCIRRQEFVVGGYTDPSGSRKRFGALLLGYHDMQDKLVYCGRVGTGFNARSLKHIHEQLTARVRESPPFDELPEQLDARGVHWARPELVVEASFANWTDEGLLRQASFQGMREDKEPQEIVREEPADFGGKVSATPSAVARSRDARRSKSKTESMNTREKFSVSGERLTHPDRVLYPDQGVTKHELALFYQDIAEWILPHVVGRPLSLVRCPEGRKKSCFFQKHITESAPDSIRGIRIQEENKQATYMMIRDLPGLIALVQLGVLEIHPWGSRADRVERPDRMVFDLDPAPEIGWKAVVEGAQTVRARLEDLGLKSFVKTSGGKGLHVVVPVSRRTTWAEFKEFAKAVAVDIARQEPKRYVATMSKAKRKGKIFIDWLRNGRGATSVAAYSTRARAGAPVSTPLRWDELGSISGAAAYTLANLPQRLTALDSDPWEGFFDLRQSATRAMREALGK